MLRSMFRVSMALLVGCALALAASAQMIRVTDPELVGTADLIIIGTVKSTTTLPNEPSWQGGQAIITVDQVLWGANLKQVTVRYPMRPTLPPGVMMTDFGGITLTVGQQQLFFLQRAQGGYALIGGGQGMKPVTDADKFKDLIAKNPLTVTLEGTVGPCYFGQTVEVKMNFSNAGKETLQINQPMLEGFYYSERLGNQVSFTTVRDNLAPVSRVTGSAPNGGNSSGQTGIPANPPLTVTNLTITVNGVVQDNNNQTVQISAIPVTPDTDIVINGHRSPLTIDAGKTLEMTAKFNCTMPQDWHLLSPDTYVQTAAALRVRVFVMPAATSNAKTPGWSIASPWQTTMVGYAPPTDMLTLSPNQNLDQQLR